VLEAVTGMDYAEVLAEEFFQPLGLESLHHCGERGGEAGPAGPRPPAHARGYGLRGGELVPAPPERMEVTRAAVGLPTPEVSAIPLDLAEAERFVGRWHTGAFPLEIVPDGEAAGPAPRLRLVAPPPVPAGPLLHLGEGVLVLESEPLGVRITLPPEGEGIILRMAGMHWFGEREPGGALSAEARPMDPCSHRGYISSMRVAGIREIKNSLSEYLRYVADGETVLVTHRGQVVAQLAPPPLNAPPPLHEDEALRRLAAAGKLRLPGRRVPSPGEGPVQGIPADIDVAALLAEVRADPGDR